MRSWMDVTVFPLDETEHEAPAQLDDNVMAIHSTIAAEEESGRRVLLGGFSQGGALALAAGLSYTKPLVGVVCFSGWLVKRSTFDTEVAHEANQHTPVLMAHGDADQAVRFDFGSLSAERLKELGYNVEWHAHRGMGHSSNPEELDQLREFIRQVA